MAHEDIVDLIARFRKEAGQPISTANRFNMAVINSLWHIVAGGRHDFDDPKFQEVIKKLNAFSGKNFTFIRFGFLN